jgi:hypothetical protein
MDLGGNVKGIHLFNLGGIYVPLSSFLRKAYESITKFEGAPHSYVKVDYSPKSTNYVKQSALTYESWEK